MAKAIRVIAAFLSILLLLVVCGLFSEKSDVEDPDIWKLLYNTDMFDDPTEEWVITNRKNICGTFVTGDGIEAKLFAKLYIEEERLSVKLWSYGGYVVKNLTAADKQYTVSTKWDDGATSAFCAYIPVGGDKLVFSVVDSNYIIQKLQDNEEVNFHILESNYGEGFYLFAVERGNFTQTYKKAISKEK